MPAAGQNLPRAPSPVDCRALVRPPAPLRLTPATRAMSAPHPHPPCASWSKKREGGRERGPSHRPAPPSVTIKLHLTTQGDSESKLKRQLQEWLVWGGPRDARTHPPVVFVPVQERQNKCSTFHTPSPAPLAWSRLPAQSAPTRFSGTPACPQKFISTTKIHQPYALKTLLPSTRSLASNRNPHRTRGEQGVAGASLPDYTPSSRKTDNSGPPTPRELE